MAAILQVLATLLRSHGAHLSRRAKALALWGLLVAGIAVLAAIYGVILATHLLALWLGTSAALALVFAAALLGLVVSALLLRREGRRLVQAHREHVEQERLAVRAGLAEAASAARLSASLAGLSASLAALIVVILRRLGAGAGPASAEAEKRQDAGAPSPRDPPPAS